MKKNPQSVSRPHKEEFITICGGIQPESMRPPPKEESFPADPAPETFSEPVRD